MHQQIFPRSLLSLSLAAALPVWAGDDAAEAPPAILQEVLVTAPPMETPLEIRFDAKAAQQPLPAQDGAAFLKAIPGMSLIRKGGTDGDPVFRGLAGSRLNILIDGEQLQGGCGMRMDPPTAYVFPETFDQIRLLKGPQTVRYGPGNVAGVVLFERDPESFATPGGRFYGSVLGGSFGRHDEIIDGSAGNSEFYVRGSGNHSRSDDYQDGDGKDVHSAYRRWNASGALGWTPDPDTRLEISAVRSDGEAAYADRSMDGVKFDRENFGIKLEKLHLTPWLEKLEAQLYYNYIDHVMDNYSLRTSTSGSMMANNPDRETTGGSLVASLRAGDKTQLVLGLDGQSNQHSLRSTMNELMLPYENLARTEDANFNQTGLFGELTQQLTAADRLVAGVRADFWRAEDQRQTLKLGTATVANPTAGAERDDILPSGFVRYERDLGAGVTLYGGLGHVERFPDYWELVSSSKEGPTEAEPSAFASTDPERTSQLDIGALWKSGPWSGYLAGFANQIDDYILIQSNVKRGSGDTARTVSITRNIDASTWGGEAGLSYAFTPQWKGEASLAYVRGENDSDDHALAQMPPLEGRLSLTWDNGTWTAGGLLRLVSEQDRYALYEGNIVGQDLGPTDGFAVFSLHGGWRPTKRSLVTAGVDNLFDATYAEHISRSGAMVPGYEQTTQVNEPGRTLWVKASLTFD